MNSTVTHDSFPIGVYGDQIELHNLGDDNHRIVCWSVDHYGQYNSMSVYHVHKIELQELTNFINKYLENN